MSDNLKRYCAIRAALEGLAPKEMSGNQLRHLRTLAALMSGIVGSGQVNLPAVASKVPDGKQREERVASNASSASSRTSKSRRKPSLCPSQRHSWRGCPPARWFW